MLAFPMYAIGLEQRQDASVMGESGVTDIGRRPKVALVLCGGGAKGAAHVGVIKALEESGVEIDMVLGTSIGGIVGGLYAMGYDSHKMDSLFRNVDWTYLLSNNVPRRDISFDKKLMDDKYLFKVPFATLYDRNNKDIRSRSAKNNSEDLNAENPATAIFPSGLVNGQNVFNLLTTLSGGYQDSLDFKKDLPVPFVCIATDLSAGTQVILDSGYLPSAIRATMAIPGYFTPVTINGKVLVDGGMVNNFPTDVAKEMGADIIIGVNIQNDLLKPEELNSLPSIFNQIIGLLGNERFNSNLKLADVLVEPDVSNYGMFSFTKPAIDSLIINGYAAGEAARRSFDEIAQLQKKYPAKSGYKLAATAREIDKESFKVAEIVVNGVTESDAKWLLRKAGIKVGDVITGGKLNSVIDVFYGTGAFKSVSYKLQKTAIGKDRLVLDFVKGPANILAVGTRFDSEEAAAILLHLGVHTRDLFGSRLALTGRLSYNAYVKADYSYIFKNIPKLNLSYMFKSTDMNIYEKGEFSEYMCYNYNKLEAFVSNIYLRNFDFQGGVRFESFNYRHFLSKSLEVSKDDLDAENYLSYYVSARMDSRDKKVFSTRGMAFDAQMALFQPNFHNGNSIFATLKLNVIGAIPLSSGVNLLPALYYRSMIGNEKYLPYVNYAGGSEYGRYISQQIPFVGINYADIFESSIMVGRIDLRGCIGKNHYLYGIVNYMRSGEKFDSMFDRNGHGYWGAGIKYAYETPLGPISANCHWSDYNHKVGFYVNLGYYF
ncbi:MAG: patatin-like phospholipase family protein [Bacteroidales bacterium]|nr:patatin-like phospholipase family protein [Bacteroidales bacterium]